MKLVWKWQDAVVRLTGYSWRQPCRSAVVSSGKQWLLLTCWSFCRQREHEITWSCETVWVSCVCFRWSTPHLEARLKGCTSTIWLWVWCFWPEDAMRRRPSVSCFWGVHRESVLMLFCWFYVVWRTYEDHKKDSRSAYNSVSNVLKP